MRTISELIDTLIANSHVLAIIEFGNNHPPVGFTEGDYDVLVVLDELDYQAKTIHFYVGDTPIDLSLRTLDYFREVTSLSGFETAFVEGRVIYDPTGEMGEIIERLRHNQTIPTPLAENEVMRIRHWHRHILDKIQGRKGSSPAFCHFLVNANVYWLFENYFRVRGLEYQGPTRAYDYLEQHEPEIYECIEDIQAVSVLEEKVRLMQQLTELILEPVGGMWQRGEVIAFGENESWGLQAQAQEIYRMLFGKSKPRTS